jgi:hypothetical protein
MTIDHDAHTYASRRCIDQMNKDLSSRAIVSELKGDQVDRLFRALDEL